jgi:hypothetical protein
MYFAPGYPAIFRATVCRKHFRPPVGIMHQNFTKFFFQISPFLLILNRFRLAPISGNNATREM